MEKLEFFTAQKLSDRITCITGLTKELMFLVEGDHSVALIDTGIGVGDLKAYVETLTQKPITVILTHGHLDHAGGAGAFDNVYLNLADREVFTEHNRVDDQLKDYIKMFLKDRFPLLKPEDYTVRRSDNIKGMFPGDRFDLGGIHLSIFDGAGHTPGSVAILIEEERTLLLGDAANFMTFLFFDYSLPIRAYKENMETLAHQVDGKFDSVLLSHGRPMAPQAMLRSIIDLCDDILRRNTDDVPMDFMGMEAVIAKRTTGEMPQLHREDGGLANIVYAKNQID